MIWLTWCWFISYMLFVIVILLLLSVLSLPAEDFLGQDEGLSFYGGN